MKCIASWLCLISFLACLPAMAQSSNVSAFCRGGQIFLTWKESSDAKEYVITRLEGEKSIELIRVPKGSGIDFVEKRIATKLKKNEVPRGFIIQPGAKPLAQGTGLWVHTVQKAGTARYQVTTADGQLIGQTSVEERPGTPVPILESITNLGKNRVSRIYIHWATPEMSYIDGHPFKFAVQTGPDFKLGAKLPLFLQLHGWTSIFAHIPILNEPGIALSADDYTQGLPPDGNDWWYGYSNQMGSDLNGSTIVNYTEKRLLYTLKWVMKQYPIDENRVYVRGGSMGGTGSISLGFRHPELFAAIDANVPRVDPNIGPRSKTLETIWGAHEWNLKTSDGDTVWVNRDLTHLVANTHRMDLPFLKNIFGRGDTTIEWEQVLPFYQALQNNKLGFAGFWGTGPHSNAAKDAPAEYKRFQISRFKRNESYPAISNLSANNNLGNGDKKDGDPVGMMNGGFDWQIVADTSTRWEMTLTPVDPSVKKSTLDLTPYRLQKLKSVKGHHYRFQVWDLSTGELTQKGMISPDQWGFLTIEQLKVAAGGNRVVIEF